MNESLANALFGLVMALTELVGLLIVAVHKENERD